MLAAAILAAAVAAGVVIVLTAPPSARQPRRLESFFQDDDHLIYAPTATVASTLDELRSLGVDDVRVTILWRAIAPDPTATKPPSGFDPSNPADYAASAWVPYDRLVELARARGIGVDFNVGSPGPLWAMGQGAPQAKYADDWTPSAAQFRAFVTALGRRYSGIYAPPREPTLPRVDFWSIWNEPNQPGWLSPQWQSVDGLRVTESAVLYRSYVDAAFAALERTGHGPHTDTILIGELAPEGDGNPTFASTDPVAPIPFLNALYCVDANDRPVTGPLANALGCPRNPAAFATAHPGLFDASGFAHHPYAFFIAPSAQMTDTNFVPLSGLPRLERALDSIFGVYGVGRRLPLYLTEYGYETNPPNPFRGVSPAIQALYINEGEYLAWRDPRVRAMSQFLLYDALPDTSYPRGSQRYWSTFQTGLLYANGTPKPSLGAYRVPIYVPDQTLGPDESVQVWGRLRPAVHDGPTRAGLQWAAPRGAYRTVAAASASRPSYVLDARLRLPGPGTIRLAWRSPAGQLYYSRPVEIRGH